MQKEEVEKYIIDFKRQNKGLDDVKFKVFDSIGDAFPKLAKEDQEKNRFQGAYYPVAAQQDDPCGMASAG